MAREIKIKEFDLRAFHMFSLVDDMKVREFQFPGEHPEQYEFVHKESSDAQSGHFMDCVARHIGCAGNSIWRIADWLRKAADQIVLEFVQEIVQLEQEVSWTGYRVLASTRVDGSVKWKFELVSDQSRIIATCIQDAPAMEEE